MSPHVARHAVRALLDEHRGQIFSCRFIKKDGSLRKMVCRTGVQKNLKGKGLKFKPKDYGLYSVYDMQKRGYRFVNLNTLLHLRMAGREYDVYDEEEQQPAGDRQG